MKVLKKEANLDFTCEEVDSYFDNNDFFYLGAQGEASCGSSALALTAKVSGDRDVTCEDGSIALGQKHWLTLTCENEERECNEESLTPTCAAYETVLNGLLDRFTPSLVTLACYNSDDDSSLPDGRYLEVDTDYFADCKVTLLALSLQLAVDDGFVYECIRHEGRFFAGNRGGSGSAETCSSIADQLDEEAIGDNEDWDCEYDALYLKCGWLTDCTLLSGICGDKAHSYNSAIALNNPHAPCNAKAGSNQDGFCIDTNTEECDGAPVVTGHCFGRAHIKCCPTSKLATTTTTAKTTTMTTTMTTTTTATATATITTSTSVTTLTRGSTVA